MELQINGRPVPVDAEPDMPLLWVLRDMLNLTGTKFGCGVAACGACTVHIDGVAQRSCQVQIGGIEGTFVTTIEGLSDNRSHPVQRAWLEQQVPQCGFCQSGMIMAVSALLKTNPNPSRADVRAAISNICRCGTYPRVEAAVLRAAEMAREE